MSNFTTSKHLKDNYDNYYDEDGESEWRQLCALDKADNITSLCESYPHNSILEIGAGEGSILKRLSELEFGKELYGLELSHTGVETIHNKGISSLVECKEFDGYNIPYEDKKFDLVIMSHVIEHVEYPRRLIYEASRVGNVIFIEVPLEDTIRLTYDFVWDKVGHINFYSPKTIRRLIQTCGLEVLNQKITHSSKEVYKYSDGKAGIMKYIIKEFILRAAPVLASKIYTYHSSIICKKT
jgi:ubiquinone/menaquinone biosynthesis C-methylase UbiE